MQLRIRVRQWLTLALADAARGQNRHRRLRGRGARIESLETRTLLAAFVVNSAADDTTANALTTLREAILLANANAGADTITFAASTNGTEFDLSLGQMEISETVTITGNGAANTFIDAQQLSRIFDITNTAGDVTLNSLALRNGRTTGNNADFSDQTFSGGAVRSLSSGTLTVSQSTLSGNSTAGSFAHGGAIFARFGAVTVSQSTLSGNSTAGSFARGGAISAFTGALTVGESTLSGNFTAGSFAHGGAISANAGAVTVSQSTLSGNSTAGDDAFGGAIALPGSGNATITNSTLSGNQVLGAGAFGGGALFFDDGDVTITNSTITGNSANIGGGIGIYADGAGESLTIRNSIIAGNTAATNPDFTAPANPGANLSVQNSLIGNNASTALTEDQDGDANGNFIGGSGANVINPQLGPLQNNGGPTFTHALLIGSLAINSGSNALAAGLATDQRGTPIARIFNTTVDMGAYELFTIVVSIVVSTTTDEVDSDISTGDLSLREAILLANGSPGTNTITFAASTNGTEFDLSLGQMEISETVTITGNGAANTVIDAQQRSRIFDITNTAGDVTLNSLALRNGRTTGNNADISGFIFSGGAVRSRSSGTLTVSQSTLSGNSTAADRAYGGAIDSRFGAVTVSQSTLSGNSTAGSVARGGAIHVRSGAVTVSQSTLSGNSTAGSFANGGAIYAYSGAVTVSQSTLSGNSTAGSDAYGGAINAFSGAVTVSQSTLSGNSTEGIDSKGGAICAFSALTVSQSTLSGNSTAGDRAFGGAIASPESGNVTITNSTLSGNQVLGAGAYGGGALYFDDGDVTITNSTITGNSANIGGGIGMRDDDPGESLTIRNSIIAGNTAATNPDFTAPANPGTNLVVANSLIGRSDGTSKTPTVGMTPDADGNFIGGATAGTAINPQFGPLANNGGPTFTHALLIGSLAIDSGSNALAVGLTTDQRGVPFARILDGNHVGGAVVDMGAFESVGIRVISPNPNAFSLRPTFTWTAIAGATSYNIQINNESTNVAQFHLGSSGVASYTPPVNLAIGKFKMWIRPNFAAGPGNWSAPHLFNNLTAPTWQAMQRTQLTSRPTLNWNALPGAAKFDLWVDNFSTGQKQVIRQEVTGTTFSPAADLAMGLYRCWIRGIDAKGNFANWSVLQELLVVPGPTPVGPLSATFDRTPTFAWNPVAGAARYELFVKNLTTNAMVINGQSVAGTNFTPASNLADGLHRWWTIAVSQAFTTGAIKSGGSHPLDSHIGGRPTFISPAPGSSTSDRTPTFSWKPVDGAATYRLQVNRTDVVQNNVINQAGLTGTSFTPATDLLAGTYRAWVRAVSSTNELSAWSIEVNFTVTAVAPPRDSPDLELTLTGLLVSELTEPDQGAVPADVSNRSASQPVADQPDLPDLDCVMMEFALHEFSYGERQGVSRPSIPPDLIRDRAQL